VIAVARGFVRDVLRAFTWQKVLVAQLLAGGLDLIVVLMRVGRVASPPTFTWSRFVIAETMAFSILMAVLIAEQAVARGARAFRSYTIAILVASVFSTVVQYEIRTALGFETSTDRPGVAAAVRKTQMVYAGCDALTYGVIFIVCYLDYRRRERLLHRVRAAELERARREQNIVRSQLAALRTDVDAVELLATLEDLQESFERGLADADSRLDGVISSLRSKLAPVEGGRSRVTA
jgi:hypothetical protein